MHFFKHLGVCELLSIFEKDFKVGRYVLPYCNQLFCSLLLLKGGSDLWGHCIFWVAGLSCDTSVVGFSVIMGYSNKCACTFISGKVCLLSSIKVRRQSLSKINVHARLFGTLEYVRSVALSTKFVCFYKETHHNHQELWDNPKQNCPEKSKAGRNWI